MKKLLIVICIFCSCLLVTGCFSAKKEEVKEEKVVIKAERISYSKLNDIVSNYSDHVNVDVVDVRSEDEFESGHIVGSINIPYSELDDIIISTDREIIVYGKTAANSRQAANDLIALGYTNVKYITGINNWPYDLED